MTVQTFYKVRKSDNTLYEPDTLTSFKKKRPNKRSYSVGGISPISKFLKSDIVFCFVL